MCYPGFVHGDCACMAIHGHFPAQPVLGSCFSTGKRSVKPLSALTRRPTAAFGGGRPAGEWVKRGGL